MKKIASLLTIFLFFVSKGALSGPKNKIPKTQEEDKPPRAYNLVNHEDSSWLSLRCDFTDKTHAEIECNSIEVQLNKPRMLQDIIKEKLTDFPSLEFEKEMKKNPEEFEKMMDGICSKIKKFEEAEPGDQTKSFLSKVKNSCQSKNKNIKDFKKMMEYFSEYEASTCSVEVIHHKNSIFKRRGPDVWVHDTFQFGMCNNTGIETISRDSGSVFWKYTDLLLAVGKPDSSCDKDRKQIHKPHIYSNEGMDTIEIACKFLSAKSLVF